MTEARRERFGALVPNCRERQGPTGSGRGGQSEGGAGRGLLEDYPSSDGSLSVLPSDVVSPPRLPRSRAAVLSVAHMSEIGTKVALAVSRERALGAKRRRHGCELGHGQ
jgi:hypothetical protein